MILTKKCAFCGTEFKTTNNKRIYCGRTCQNRVYQERKKEKEEIIQQNIQEQNEASKIYMEQMRDLLMPNRLLEEAEKQESLLPQNSQEYLELKTKKEEVERSVELYAEKVQTLEQKLLEKDRVIQKLELDLIKVQNSPKQYLGWIAALIIILPYAITKEGRGVVKSLFTKEFLDEILKFLNIK